LAVNHKPVIRDTSEAMWRRVLFVKFNSYFPPEIQDKQLTAILRDERSGILNWAIEGCTEWLDGGLKPPPEVLAATKEYRNESDALGRFIDEMCLKEGTVTISDLHEAFCRWWLANESEEPWIKRTFANKLRERGFSGVKGGRSGGGHWEGITLK
jgi:putative DNA primase/helicase